MTPAVKVKVLEAAAIALIAGGLTVFEQSIRARVKVEESGAAWVEAARVKESIPDGLSGSS